MKEGSAVHLIEEIVERFPIRKNEEQKQAFLRYAVARGKKLGYNARVEENGKHFNFVAGNPDTARVLFTAHYDTPAVMPLPNLMLPRNPLLFYLYHFVPVLLLLIISAAFAFGVFALTHERRLTTISFLLAYYALLLLMIMGPANKHNVNDNTSGVATVLRLMELLPEDARGKAAFALFDNEEKGMRGSKAFALRHDKVKKETLVVNLDCVGVGDHVLFIAKARACAKAEYAALSEHFSPAEGLTPHFYPAQGSVMNSDHKSFRCGVGVAACRRAPVAGYYTAHIHTRRDTEADPKNIEYLASGLCAFVESLSEN
ncbi:MAG: M28 family peptidase [Clostridia bacterium]|nr:M28 family peptidase [Clostridia bacterium]